jgi:8-oxo-dGTP pyrophosphatase MutT (NUDIX family)
LIIRVVPPANYSIPDGQDNTLPSQSISIQDFFEQDWVNAPGARPEILYLRRRKGDSQGTNGVGQTGKKAESHVAFPGGRMEDGDEDGLYTGKQTTLFSNTVCSIGMTLTYCPAMRQTWEEIGLDLAERSFTCIGQLDDREITTSLGKRLLMVLSPYVFLQLVPQTQPTDPPPETTLHWTPLSSLINTKPAWSTVDVDISSRLAPRDSIVRSLIQILVGSMRFDAIVLNGREYPRGVGYKKRDGFNFATLESSSEKYDPYKKDKREGNKNDDELRLWGLTLGMTMDFMSHMKMHFQPSGLSSPDGYLGGEMATMAASMT